MIKRNKNLAKLQAGYLFPQIEKKKNDLKAANPDADIISLGVGNTTQALGPAIVKGLKKAVKAMGTNKGYMGYGPDLGYDELRKKISEKLYNGIVDYNNIIISDGAKCEIGRLQVLFSSAVKVAVQDPSYPVYVDGSVIAGATGDYVKETERFENLIYLECNPANNFFPDLSAAKDADILYFCSPNNPTGAVATKSQLAELVQFAKDNKTIIIYDSAYSTYIRNDELPKSIFEIEGAKECAIEVNSFSKPAGFTGLRLGWSIVHPELKYDDGTPLKNDWERIVTTAFNGASNIVQFGGIAALSERGYRDMLKTVNYYMVNAEIINSTLKAKGIKTHGGINAPYIWAEFPGKDSWAVFEDILNKAHVVTTPGAGFGKAGDGFIRFSAFGHRKNILTAAERLDKNL